MNKKYSENLTKSELLKIKIIANGIKITKRAKEMISDRGRCPLSVSEYPTTGGVILKIKGTEIYVNASFDSDIFPNASISLDYIDGDYFLGEGCDRFLVNLIPLPKSILEKNKKGILFSDLAMVHLDRLRLSPIDGCSFSCKFCDMSKWRYRKQHIKDLINAGKKAIKESNYPVSHILISGGTPKKGDWEYLDKAIKKISESFNIPIDVMMTPIDDFDYIKKLKEYGIRELSINLEIYDDVLAKEIIPQKAVLGREFYFSFLKEAVKIFGKGNVRSILIVGLEPIESTLKGVEEMIKIGVSPVLSPLIPSANTELGKTKGASEKMMIEVWNESCKIVNRYKNGVGLGPRCKLCQHNTLTFPGHNQDFYY